MSTRHPPRAGLVAIASVLALGLVLTACGGDGDESGEPLEPGVVEVDDNFFRPETIRITTGETVTWRWVGNIAHNVIHDGPDEFRSKTQTKGTFEHTFDSPGEYDYVCTLHTGMDGTVVVTDG